MIVTLFGDRMTTSDWRSIAEKARELLAIAEARS